MVSRLQPNQSERATVAQDGVSDMGIENRGFASLDESKRREVSSKGGRAAHAKGTAHMWNREEASAAGRKGGVASAQRRKGRVTVGTASTASHA